MDAIRRFLAADRRTWILRVAVGVVIPAAFFLLLEGVLWTFGFGYDTDFILEHERGEQVACVGNQDFCLSFFPKPLLRSPGRIMFETPKPEGTVRVFVFGASAAMGDPLPAFAFSRILDVMLAERLPGKRIEVINTSITAVNSNVLLPIVEDCAAYEPDLFVVYVGNNEVTGPFGPGTVFAPFAGSRTMIRWSIALKATKTGQLLSAVADAVSGYQDVPQGWGGLTMFANHGVSHDDARLASVYSHYRENLQDICGSAACPVVLCTVASNLRDCPPFMSLRLRGLDESKRAAWEAAFAAGKDAEGRGAVAEAARQYEAAADLDRTHAELQYRLARSLAGAGRHQEALEHFTMARDCDAIRIRADTELNRIVRDVAAGANSRGVLLADVSDALAAASPHGVSGEECFYEHVHMNFHGNYLAARCVLDAAVAALGLQGDARVPDERACAARLGLTAAEEQHMQQKILGLVTGAPFTGQIDHERMLEARRATLRDIERRSASGNRALMDRDYRSAIEARPDDWLLHDNYARFLLLDCGDPASAAREWRRTVALLPFDHLSHANLGVALVDCGELDAARECFDTALGLRPGDPTILAGMASAFADAGQTASARQALAELTAKRTGGRDVRNATVAVFTAEGRYDEAAARMAGDAASPAEMARAYNALAVSLLRGKKKAKAEALLVKAIELDGEQFEPQHNLARLYQAQGKHDLAAQQFGRAVALAPDLVDLRLSYAKALARVRKTDQAIAEYERVLQREPRNAQAHSDAGAMLAQAGRMQEAVEHFAEAVRLEPDLLLGRVNLANALGALGRHREAVAQLARAIEISPRTADFHYMLGAELVKLGDASGARASLTEALRLNPDHAPAKRLLGTLVAPTD
jgi:tetratricopeptide (TPR) repeat protein